METVTVESPVKRTYTRAPIRHVVGKIAQQSNPVVCHKRRRMCVPSNIEWYKVTANEETRDETYTQESESQEPSNENCKRICVQGRAPKRHVVGKIAQGIQDLDFLCGNLQKTL